MAACKSDVPFNFSSASGRDNIVHGSARPGAIQKRCYNENDKVTEAEVKEWAEFMQGQGVSRVIGLLTQSEVATYARPPVETLKEQGLQAVNVDLEGDAAAGGKQVLQHLEEATAAGEKVVVHCWGGGGRAGKVLAAWLVNHYGVPAEQAGPEVVQHAKGQGASRRADVAAVQQLLA